MSYSSEAGLSRSSIGMLIVAARRSIRQLIAGEVVPLKITPHHYWMLMVINNGKPMCLGELARAMWMDNPTVSRLVHQMGSDPAEPGKPAGQGYLKMGKHPHHGRRVVISLTEKGEAFCNGPLTEIHTRYHQAAMAGLAEGEEDQLRNLLCKFMRNLDTMVAADPGKARRPHHPPVVAEDNPPLASGGI